MNNKYRRLSDYIDTLNEDRKPKEHGREGNGEEFEELMATVRSVRVLKEPVDPEQGYAQRLAKGIIGDHRQPKDKNNHKIQGRYGSKILMITAAAAVVLVLAVSFWTPFSTHTSPNVVYAMEQAMKEVKAYHGTIEVVETNTLGEITIQAVREVWADSKGNYYVKELTGTAADTVTANNGERKWQLAPEDKKAYLFPAFPDPYRFTFELGREIENVSEAQKVKTLGEERIAGRQTTLLEVTPKGGEPYRLWIDQETRLPLQRESAVQNALQYRITYREIDFEDSIPEENLRYQLPEGYQEVALASEQIVGSRKEAEDMVNFTPMAAVLSPQGYTLEKMSVIKEQGAVKYYYTSSDGKKTVVIQQNLASEEFKPASSAVLGKAGEKTVEALYDTGANSLRWQENGMEYYVLGDADMEELVSFTGEAANQEIVLPAVDKSNKENLPGKEPEVKVEVDLTAEANDQKSVDAGHSPWRLDPVFVTQVFASLLLSPEGITGEYPIDYDTIEIIENNGSEAVAKINQDNSIAEYVYLRRLIRQDETGIWTVVGYDKRK